MKMIVTRNSLLYIQEEVQANNPIAIELLAYLNEFEVVDKKTYFILITTK
jgi:hypothetical protein